MGWSIGYDTNWERDIGYGVPAKCDFPGCEEEIDRGLSYVCGSNMYGGSRGCGLYFCEKHREYHPRLKIDLCERCGKRLKTFTPKQDVAEWINFKLKDDSWKEWRKENPDKVKQMKNQLRLPVQ